MSTKSVLSHKAQFAFGSAILTLLIVGTFSYREMTDSRESARSALHTHEVLENLHDLISAMETIDSSYRGFALSGEESYFESFGASKLSAKQNEITLRTLTLDDLNLRSQIPALDKLAGQEIQFGEMVIGLSLENGSEAASQAIRDGENGRTMDEYRKAIRQMQDEELRLLALSDAGAQRRFDQSKTVVILGSILGLLIAFAAAWMLHKDSFRQMLAEEALRHSEEEYQMLLDGVHDYAIYLLDPRGTIATWNTGAERIQGYKAEEIIGQNYSCFFLPEEIKQGRPEEILRITAAIGRYEEQGMRVRKDGLRFLAGLIFTAMRDSAGNLRGFSEVGYDLSQSKESDAKYQRLLEAAPDAMVVVNQVGDIDKAI